MCYHRLVLVSCTIGINTLKVTNLQKSVKKFDEFLIRCSILIRKVKLKFFLDFEPALEMTYELNC